MDDARQLLGRRIRHFRNLREMTQQELGEKSGINYKYLGAMERGEKNCSIAHLVRTAEALDVPLYELFVFEHETDNVELLREKIDSLLKEASTKEIRSICRVIEAMVI